MGTRETEVRLDWCEGGFRQQRNDSGGCATMRGRVESPGTYVTMCFTRPFFLVTVFFQTALFWLSPGEGRDAVGIYCKKSATTENQGSGKYMG